MLNFLSVLVGLVALTLLVILFIFPVLGAVGSWVALPIAALGGALGALSSSNGGRNFNIFILALAVLRLWIGGGIL
ncbi:MAG: hypothetical protein WA979_07685 [Pacificimonas sp.]